MKTAVRPIADARDKAVPDRIVVNVVDMPREIVIVANDVLPVAPLPDAFSRLAILLGDREAAPGRPRENPLLMRFHRLAKSASPTGSVQTACK